MCEDALRTLNSVPDKLDKIIIYLKSSSQIQDLQIKSLEDSSMHQDLTGLLPHYDQLRTHCILPLSSMFALEDRHAQIAKKEVAAIEAVFKKYSN